MDELGMIEAEADMRACRAMDNRGLVAPPGHVAAYFPSGGQGGITADVPGGAPAVWIVTG
jgi:hypothetical protein